MEELQAEEEEIFGNNRKNKENLSSRQMLSDSLETTINNVSIKINQMRIRIQKFNEKINKHTALVLSIPQIVIESVKNDNVLGLGFGELNIKKRLILSNEFQILLYKSKKEDIHMVHSKRILLFDSPKINLKTLEHSTIELTLDGSNMQLDANIKALRGALNPALLDILAQFFPFDYFNQSNIPSTPDLASTPSQQSFFATPLVATDPTTSVPPELSPDLYSSIFKSSLEGSFPFPFSFPFFFSFSPPLFLFSFFSSCEQLEMTRWMKNSMIVMMKWKRMCFKTLKRIPMYL